MSYVDAMWVRDRDIIKVVERDSKQNRVYREYPANYTFYYPDKKGKYNSIYGEKLTKVTCKTWKDFMREQKIHSKKSLYESDLNQTFKCLEENYLGKEAPKLNVAYFDIESDFDPEKGYASPDDPFMPITAISVHLQWLDTLICVAIPPKTLTIEKARELISDIPNTFLFETEYEMLDAFLVLIEDADVISGWNSEGYDIPYTVNRVTKVMSRDDTRRFCLWNQFPKDREYERYGKTAKTYDLVGRVHLDSLELYRKYTPEERHSFRLDYIGEQEIGEHKTVYEGTLDQLYNNDFHKFIEYNRQDCALLNKLDKKLKFMELANAIAHENTVLLQTTMGAVASIEQAIINEAHHHGLIVPSRNRKNDKTETHVAGAYVAHPKKGLHDWIGIMDINSLYPSIIRALNMSPETIIGQLRQDYTTPEIEEKMLKKMTFAAAYEGKFGSNEYELVMANDRAYEITIDWETGESDTLSGAQIYDLIFESNRPWMLSANGTIFTYEKEGIIPGLLKRWYAERKEFQKKKKQAEEVGDKELVEYWDKKQQVKKLNLNSCYGILLAPSCRFFDIRMGQSTTLSGRQVVKHMNSKVNEVITGEYDHVGKSCIYSDTDSSIFSAYSTLKNEINKKTIPWDKEVVIQLYDSISEEVNSTFPDFMFNAFHCPNSRGEVIKAGREIVGTKGLFITKKRYAIQYYDKEGTRLDVNGKPGKIKAMGLDLKRSDTPEFMQDFLEKVLIRVLNGAEEPEILEMISKFRTEFKARPGWEKGTPKRVNKLTQYQAKETEAGKANMPGHVRAAINWNTLKRMNGDKYSMSIVDGMKAIVCKLRDNPMGFKSVAYPTDELRIPKWFQDLPFDDDGMESTIINNKLDNLIGVLGFDLESTVENNTFNSFFTFK
jgi:DNA polymerase elongation subunit (family B)